MAAPEPGVFAVTGPVQAEILVLTLTGGGIALTGPCGAAPWFVELGRDVSPTDVVRVMASTNIGEPAVVHSTSWRHARGGVVLTFVAVVEASAVDGLSHAPVERAALARGGPATAPAAVPDAAVVEHGLRHLAWLASDDPAVAAALPAGWLAALTAYVPEPFRQL